MVPFVISSYSIVENREGIGTNEAGCGLGTRRTGCGLGTSLVKLGLRSRESGCGLGTSKAVYGQLALANGDQRNWAWPQ